MSSITDIEPKKVFKFFNEISQIPRPSYHEEAISDYVFNFAKDRKLEVHQDKYHNVIIIKEASEGYEKAEPVILQGHMDMVCEKEPGCTKDMDTEGLDLQLDGDILSAKGTTLGADNGIAVAMMLALLDDEELKHPRIECVFTTAEEVGMDGAREIDLSILRGRRLLNLDSECEGELLASCAGGGRADIRLPLRRERARAGVRLLVAVTGLTGGHSGDEINKGRANATILLNHVLIRLWKEAEASIIAIEGGSKDNAIPREARALVAIPRSKETVAYNLISDLSKEYKDIYRIPDPNLSLKGSIIKDKKSLEKEDLPDDAMKWLPVTRTDTHRITTLIAALPNGVMRMSDSIPDLVETSLNLGITNMSQADLTLGYSLRSSVDASYDHLKLEVELIAKGLGADVSFHGEYPAWQFTPQSDFRELMCSTYKKLFNKDMKVSAIHAGLECGIISSKVEGIDAVSIGPDMWDVHTPNERLSVSSVARTYDYIKNILSETK
ncbi:MAG: aminoacyl-histidine dipeptidase [Lachnospiraceae bacterium]|nr:aminoacyl-histidine dipeptidase [Lachnospiraceae bacterium]